MYTMKAPNGKTLTVRTEQQKKVLEKRGYKEVKNKTE